MRQLRRIFLLLLFACVAVMLVGPWLAPFDPATLHLADALHPPDGHYLLGTDANGRDILSQILHGGRISFIISIVVVSCCVFIGSVLGFVAGWRGGWSDRLFLVLADTVQAFPGTLLAIAMAAFLTPGPVTLILVLTVVGWVGYARVIRAQVLSLKSREFILAARALGVGSGRLFIRHFFPNMLGPLIVQASFGMAGVILAESTLSFLGLGLPEDVPSLGRLIDAGVNLLLVAPHVALFPGLAIMLFVLTFNLVGDRLRARYL